MDRPNIMHIPFSEGHKQAQNGLVEELKRLEKEMREMKKRHKSEIEDLEREYAHIAAAGMVLTMLDIMVQSKIKDNTNE